jgi:hypothetical protein
LSLQKELFDILIRECGFAFNAELCGARIKETINNPDLMSVTLQLSSGSHGTTLNTLVRKEIGYLSTYSIALFIGDLMFVGNGECPYCGSPFYNEIDEYQEYEYNSDNNNSDSWRIPPTRVCHACKHEWSIEE